MQWKNLLILLLVSISLVSCGSSNDEGVEGEAAGVEMADEELGEEVEESDVDGEVAEASDEELVDEEDFVEEDELAKDDSVGSEEVFEEVADSGSAKPVIGTTGNMKTYSVGKNETLMLIAFKIYGDFRRWKDIAKHNQGVLKDGQTVSSGMVIKYEEPVEEFVWTPQGEPYLIKWGDTLGLISNNVYGTMKRWKDIWSNNKVLIKDPNKIYAGFTIYYIPDGQDVALN